MDMYWMTFGILCAAVLSVLLLALLIIAVNNVEVQLRISAGDITAAFKPLVDEQKRQEYIRKLQDAVESGEPGSDVAAGMLYEELHKH